VEASGRNIIIITILNNH